MIELMIEIINSYYVPSLNIIIKTSLVIKKYVIAKLAYKNNLYDRFFYSEKKMYLVWILLFLMAIIRILIELSYLVIIVLMFVSMTNINFGYKC